MGYMLEHGFNKTKNNTTPPPPQQQQYSRSKYERAVFLSSQVQVDRQRSRVLLSFGFDHTGPLTMTWILNGPQVPHVEGLVLNATVFRGMWDFGRLLHCEDSGLMNRLMRSWVGACMILGERLLYKQDFVFLVPIIWTALLSHVFPTRFLALLLVQDDGAKWPKALKLWARIKMSLSLVPHLRCFGLQWRITDWHLVVQDGSLVVFKVCRSTRQRRTKDETTCSLWRTGNDHPWHAHHVTPTMPRAIRQCTTFHWNGSG